jgi:hypothetical protein
MANYKELSIELKDKKRLFKLGFLHYKSRIYEIDSILKGIDKSQGWISDKQIGNYKKIL